jgi:hypothetical protein
MGVVGRWYSRLRVAMPRSTSEVDYRPQIKPTDVTSDGLGQEIWYTQGRWLPIEDCAFQKSKLNSRRVKS